MSSVFRVWEYLSSKWWPTSSFYEHISNPCKNSKYQCFEYDITTHRCNKHQIRNSNPISYFHFIKSLHVFILFRFRYIPASSRSSKFNLSIIFFLEVACLDLDTFAENLAINSCNSFFFSSAFLFN